MDKGEERLREFGNARSIFGILDNHHRLIKKLNTGGH
jgi:hypothetical protein